MARLSELVECPKQCGMRHYPDHPHVTDAAVETGAERKTNSAPTSPNVAVVGADSPEALAAQLRERITDKKRKPITKETIDAEQMRVRIEAMKPLARKLSQVPYSATAIATFDKRWREKLKEQDVQALETATVNMMLVWGIDFSGKWSALGALLLTHAETFGNIYKEISEENAKEKRDNAQRNGVTPNFPSKDSATPPTEKKS